MYTYILFLLYIAYIIVYLCTYLSIPVVMNQYMFMYRLKDLSTVEYPCLWRNVERDLNARSINQSLVSAVLLRKVNK